MSIVPSVPPVLHTERALDDHVRAERVRFVFVQSPLPMLFSPMSAATLSVALWDLADRRTLTIWAMGTVAIAVARVLLVRTYPRNAPVASVVARWERAFVASIVVVDLWWGLGCVILLPDPLAAQVLVFSFLMLMAGGHAASYAAHPVTTSLGVLSLVVPITLLFGLESDTFHRAMAFAALMYLAAVFRSIRTLGYFFGRSHRLARDVQIERERAERLARTDFLTELNNRRAFYEVGELSLRQAHRYVRDAALLMIDIDHFKSINDRFGHAAGDAVLRGVARGILGAMRDVDVVGRLGGEEFAILLPETSTADALVAAERLREAIRALRLEHDGQSLPITVSLGVACVRPEDHLESLVARADAALYRAKHEGRDRVAVEAA